MYDREIKGFLFRIKCNTIKMKHTLLIIIHYQLFFINYSSKFYIPLYFYYFILFYCINPGFPLFLKFFYYFFKIIILFFVYLLFIICRSYK